MNESKPGKSWFKILLLLPKFGFMEKKATVGVIGAGTMGSGIAQVAASAGHRTILFDADLKVLEKAKLDLQKTFSKLIEKGRMTGEYAQQISANIMYASSINDFKDCGLIIEAIIENLGVKQKVLAELEKIVLASCILASNTSSLSITSIAAFAMHPGRVIGIHFFNPAPVLPLVEIIKGVETDSLVVSEAQKLISSWAKTTVVANDSPGFIVNRIARPYYGESIRIYEEGIADFATIDWAMKEFGKFRMGPFELMDLIGNDINYAVTESVWKQFFYDPRYKPSLTQKRLFEAKHLGRKTGRGYFDYSEGALIPEPKRDQPSGEKIFMRVLSMLINEAVDAFYLGVASREDLDLAMTMGVNYPKGLLKWCDEMDAEKILGVLNNLQEEFGEDRYRPSVLLRRMAKEKRKFYE